MHTVTQKRNTMRLEYNFSMQNTCRTFKHI